MFSIPRSAETPPHLVRERTILPHKGGGEKREVRRPPTPTPPHVGGGENEKTLTWSGFAPTRFAGPSSPTRGEEKRSVYGVRVLSTTMVPDFMTQRTLFNTTSMSASGSPSTATMSSLWPGV